MDRRSFLKVAGVAASNAGRSSQSVQADGYRRCDQIHDKLTEADIDKWTQPLFVPAVVPTKLVSHKDDVQNPQLGGGSQQIAPEFLWQHGHLTDVTSDQLHAAGHKTPRPDDIFRADEAGSPAPLQYAELCTKAIVTEVIPGWLTRILCYGFKERDADGNVIAEHFSTPGPTIKAKAGHPLVVRLRNEIDPSLMLDVSMHQHGGHIVAHADGHPGFLVEPQSMTGESKPHKAGVRDYYFPNPVPKTVKQSGGTDGCWTWEPQNEWDYAEIQNTMWYHDHAEDITAHNALMGLAGYFFLEDAPIPGKDGEPDVTGPEGWRDYLPKKQIPLVFKDLCLCPITQEDQIQPAVKDKLNKGKYFGEARIHFDPFDHNGTLGNVQVVNGVAYPYQEVKFDSYWMRMLNASLARFYNLEWLVIHPVTRQAKRLSFLRFGKDSWLFEKPMEQSSVFIGMATRADVCMDFGQLRTNSEFADFAKDDGSFEVMLLSTLNQRDGRGPGHGDNEQTVNNFPRGMADEIRDDRAAPLFLMKFIVKEDADDKATWPDPAVDPKLQQKKMEAPAILRRHHQLPVPERKDIFVRELNFERGRGAWQINKRFYDACIANVVPQLWSTELWILRNRSGGWWHPIHIHLESHQQLFVRARNHRGQRISMCREGYDPKNFDPEMQLDEGETNLNASLIRWYLAFPQLIPAGGDERTEFLKKLSGWDSSELSTEDADRLKKILNGEDDRPKRHDANSSDFDASVWNLDIKHDTTVLGPNTEVHILMRFRTFEGPFVFHCHNLDHEDMRMMYQMDPRMGLACPDEQLKVRHDYWYFNPPMGPGHCCDKTKGEHA